LANISIIILRRLERYTEEAVGEYQWIQKRKINHRPYICSETINGKEL